MTNDKAHTPTGRHISKQAVIGFSCSQLPEFDWLRQQTALKTELLQKHFGSNDPAKARLDEAIELVDLHVFKRMNYRGDGHAFVNRLMHKGYSSEQIAQALAQAWLNGLNKFELPRRSRWQLVHKLWAQLLFSLVVSIGLLALSLKIIRHSHPTAMVYLLAFPPLLGIVGFCLLFPVLWLVKRLVRHWPEQDIRGLV